MGFLYEERPSDSPLIETVTRGRTVGEGFSARPSEIHWHMVLTRYQGQSQFLLTGPLTEAGVVPFIPGVELLWIKLKLGAFMPHLPPKAFVNTEQALPEGAGQTFWLKGSVMQFPDFENVEDFIARLVRQGVLDFDPVVMAVLQGQPPQMSPRTLRHRFLRATGLTHKHILQYRRAQQAAALLERGVSILDTVHEAGYYDQPHLTRSLKRFLGKTPAQQVAAGNPA